MLPDVEVLLSVYYSMPWVGLLLFIVGLMLGASITKFDTLRYVWRVGVAHSQKENKGNYNRWLAKQRNADLE